MVSSPGCMSSRRQFIFECSAVLAGLAAAPLGALGGPTPDGGLQALDQLSHGLLAGQVGTRFRVGRPAGPRVDLWLLKAPLAPAPRAQSGRRPPADAGHEKFSLIFHGPPDPVLAPAIHRFEHARLGWFEMYIGQIGRADVRGVRYQAAFNRPPPAATA